MVLCLQMHKIQKYRYCTCANTQPQAFFNWSTGIPRSTYIYAIIAQTIKIQHEIELRIPNSKIKQHLVKDVHSINEKLSLFQAEMKYDRHRVLLQISPLPCCKDGFGISEGGIPVLDHLTLVLPLAIDSSRNFNPSTFVISDQILTIYYTQNIDLGNTHFLYL